jgi:hypothetical protein
MLWSIAAVLLVLWLLATASGIALSGFIHVLLVTALVIMLLRFLQGEKPV